MMLGYLLQQGYIYNSRQSLEMYAFRRALQLSKKEERGVNLTVNRDVLVPTFFSGVNRQRLTATASVEQNPWKVYVADEDSPEDVGTYQLLQFNEAMIRKDKYVLVPPTLVKIHSTDGEDDKWQYVPSLIREVDPQSSSYKPEYDKKSTYVNTTLVSENRTQKSVTKRLQNREISQRGVTFETENRIRDTYVSDPDVSSVEVNAGTIPGNIIFEVDETIEKEKTITTPAK